MKRLVSAGDLQGVRVGTVKTRAQAAGSFGRFAASTFIVTIMACALLLGFTSSARAYTVVQASTSAPAGLEAQFIAATTAQFQNNLLINPFVANTYQITLLGPNPQFNPLVTNSQLLNSVVTVDSWTYVAGWANGESYQQTQQIGAVGYLENLCNSATSFNLVATSTATFDRATCQDVTGTIISNLFQLRLSTPTQVPGGF